MRRFLRRQNLGQTKPSRSPNACGDLMIAGEEILNLQSDRRLESMRLSGALLISVLNSLDLISHKCYNSAILRMETGQQTV